MRPSFKIGLASLVFGYLVACSPVKFEGIPTTKPTDPTIVDPPVVSALCETDPDADECFINKSIERRVGEGLVDVLIVNDNSGSMYAEQRKMATAFTDFVSSLGSLDYRIAMTTTDISSNFSSTPVGVRNYPSAANGNGAYQDGNLLDFGSGLKYLQRSTTSKMTLFNNTIQRNETLNCEQNGFQNCPSGDERGIFAANLVLDRTASEFMRPLAHLAVIILSDEDERGLSDTRSVRDETDRALQRLYPLENYDLPETFVSRFRQRFPEKTLSVHSIVVKPGDAACLNSQTASSGTPNIRGVEGYSYAKLTQLTGGRLLSICDSNFTSNLRNIGYQLQEQVTSLPFECRPVDDDFEVTFDPQPAYDVNVTADFSKMELAINSALPPLTKVRLDYRCRKTQ